MEIVDQIGLPAVLEQLAEECAELSKAALKLARKHRGENPTPKSIEDCEREMKEEIADVVCCLKQIVSPEDRKKIADIASGKETRWNLRIAESRKESTIKKTIYELWCIKEGCDHEDEEMQDAIAALDMATRVLRSLETVADALVD